MKKELKEKRSRRNKLKKGQLTSLLSGHKEFALCDDFMGALEGFSIDRIMSIDLSFRNAGIIIFEWDEDGKIEIVHRSTIKTPSPEKGKYKINSIINLFLVLRNNIFNLAKEYSAELIFVEYPYASQMARDAHMMGLCHGIMANLSDEYYVHPIHPLDVKSFASHGSNCDKKIVKQTAQELFPYIDLNKWTEHEIDSLVIAAKGMTDYTELKLK